MIGVVSCGVVVTDGPRVLLGHATLSPRWDIPKGVAEPGESYLAAACRELLEETGLAAPPAALDDLGRHRYRPGKDLAVFRWTVPSLPDPASLVCRSTFLRHGRALPEFDRFAVVDWSQAAGMLAGAMLQVLLAVGVASA